MPVRRLVAPMLVAAVALAVPSCGESSPATAPAPTKAATEPASGTWRYADELADAAGIAPHEIVLELSRGDQGRAWVVAAIASDAVGATLQVWTFEQRPDEVVLAEAGQALVRAAPKDAAVPAHEALRRRLAAPGAVLHRPLGRPADDAVAFVHELRRLATTATGPDGAAAVEALAGLVRGVDDALVFEHDRLAVVLDVLRAPTLDLGPPEAISSRRDRLGATTPSGAWTLEVWRKGDGFVLAALDPAK